MPNFAGESQKRHRSKFRPHSLELNQLLARRVGVKVAPGVEYEIGRPSKLAKGFGPGAQRRFQTTAGF